MKPLDRDQQIRELREGAAFADECAVRFLKLAMHYASTSRPLRVLAEELAAGREVLPVQREFEGSSPWSEGMRIVAAYASEEESQRKEGQTTLEQGGR